MPALKRNYHKYYSKYDVSYSIVSFMRAFLEAIEKEGE